MKLSLMKQPDPSQFDWAQLTNSNVIALVEDTLLVGASAGLTYLVGHLTSLDVGIWTPLVVATLTSLASYLNKVVQQLLNPAPVPTPTPTPGPAPAPAPAPVVVTRQLR